VISSSSAFNGANPNRDRRGASWREHVLNASPHLAGSPLCAAVPSAPWYESQTRILSPTAYLILKRLLDVTLSLLALPLVLPVLVVCALAVRLDTPGAAFFTQVRTGRGGRRFRMLKLRTMVHNAEELKAQYAHLNELTWPDFRITDDPRVTRVGRFLRRTSLDELPQILNVLRGDMSLVGPRPTSFSADTYSLWHTARLEVQPGLTGLWQVSGRKEIDFDQRLRLDIAYIRNRCLWLDVMLLARTVGAVVGGRGAN
jgi:lipopolysaccharide/colanic/teichoic acid biosynthesis glycosyltransferase